MRKLLSLYKNRYVRFLVFVIFVVFIYYNHYGLSHIKNRNRNLEYKRKKRELTREIKNVFKKEEDKVRKSNVRPKVKVEPKVIFKPVSELPSEMVDKEFINKGIMTEKEMIKAQKKLEKEFTEVRRDEKGDARIVKCGNIVDFQYIMYLDNKMISIYPIKSSILVGAKINPKLDELFKGKRNGDILITDLHIFFDPHQAQVQIGRDTENLKKLIESQKSMICKIKILDIKDSAPVVINKYCKK